MSAFGGKAYIPSTDLDVRFWHKADIPRLSSDVRFWGNSGHGALSIASLSNASWTLTGCEQSQAWLGTGRTLTLLERTRRSGTWHRPLRTPYSRQGRGRAVQSTIIFTPDAGPFAGGVPLWNPCRGTVPAIFAALYVSPLPSCGQALCEGGR